MMKELDKKIINILSLLNETQKLNILNVAYEWLDKQGREEISSFLDYKSIEHYSSKNTLYTYKLSLNKIHDYFITRGMSISSLNRDSITKLITYMSEKKLSTKTIGVRLAALKEFLKYLIIEGKMEGLPYFECPKHEKKIPVYLNLEEINRLLDAPIPANKKVVLEILYATGLRVSELANLKISNIDFENRLCRVFGKGDKERFVPIHAKAIEAIRQYLKEVRPKLVRDDKIDNLLLTRTGKTYRRENLWELVKKSAKAAKIEKNISPHTLRHTLATHLLDNDADIRCIQEILGHASLNTTQIYTHVSIKRLKEVHKKYHPRA